MTQRDVAKRLSNANKTRGRKPLRGHRTALDDTHFVRAEVWANDRHWLDGEVLDVSLGGIRMRTPSTAPAPDSGLRLSNIRIHCGQDAVYDGGGTVVRRMQTADGTELGIELDGTELDVQGIARTAFRHGLNERFGALLATMRKDHLISPRFRAWVADLAGFLSKTETFLQAEESALSKEDAQSRAEAQAELLATVGMRIVNRLNDAAFELTELVHNLTPEEHATYRAYLQLHTARFLRQSPFMGRALDKPLGYAGDYEMMNMLYRDHADGDSVFAKALNIYATSSTVAQANINRIDYFRRAMLDLVSSQPTGRVHIASIGCGPAHEILTTLQTHPELGPRLHVTLLDQERGAISHCERTLAKLASQTGAYVQPIRHGIRGLISESRAQAALRPYDLIYSAGLFDYLSDRAFSAMIASLYACLKPSGQLIVGNVAEHNPDRWPLEYFCEWFLHHRSAEKLVSLAEPVVAKAASYDVDQEHTGINLFVRIRRPGHEPDSP